MNIFFTIRPQCADSVVRGSTQLSLLHHGELLQLRPAEHQDSAVHDAVAGHCFCTGAALQAGEV